jgi:hypothetical protein
VLYSGTSLSSIFPANFVSIVVDCPYAYDTDNTTDEQEEIQSESRTYEMKSETNITSTDNQERNIELFPPEQYGLVLYNFIAEVESDLTVSTGDTLVIVKNIDSNWVLARNDHDQVGMVPSSTFTLNFLLFICSIVCVICIGTINNY